MLNKDDYVKYNLASFILGYRVKTPAHLQIIFIRHLLITRACNDSINPSSEFPVGTKKSK